MKLNDLPSRVLVFGDTSYRGECPPEEIEQINFFSYLKLNYPLFWDIALHPKNEGKRTYAQASRDAITGSLNKGASDVIIPATVPFVCEIKRADHTKSRWEKGQEEYLINAAILGAFSCVALGAKGAIEALEFYLNECGV